MIGTLRHLILSAKYPEARRLGFLDQGFGLEHRYRRYSRHWRDHLATSRAVQQRFFQSLAHEVDELVVLGAGRLYDFNKSAAIERFRGLSLYDADPSVLATWDKLRRRFSGEIHSNLCELTGVLATWRKALYEQFACLQAEQHATRWQEALHAIAAIPEEIPPSVNPLLPPVGSGKRGILSLNILSQIPLAWQRITEAALTRCFSRAFVNEREDEWIASYIHGGARLIQHHLASIFSVDAEGVLLITDVSYSEKGDEAVDRNADGSVCSLMCGVDLDSELKKYLGCYENGPQRGWQWQLTPVWSSQGAETHAVQSFEFRKRACMERALP